ncbi:MAG: flavin reductase family protein [Actinobacteria bacterium]|nr:flavin reductase family protein [Actinomycetota bacterium]
MSPSSSEPAADEELVDRVKEVHRRFPTGVTIVATTVAGRPYGLAVNAFSSLSLEPPLVLACVAATSSTYPRLFEVDAVSVNILAHDQAAVAGAFARSGGDKFEGLEWRPGAGGAPLLAGVSAQLELAVEHRIPAGTHTIFVGRVLAASAGDKAPLLYLGGGFFDGGALRAADLQATTRGDVRGE